MAKGFKRSFLAATLACSLLPVCPVAKAEDELYVNKSFNSYCTNTTPADMEISARGAYVTEYKPENKALLIYGDANGSNIKFPVNTTDEVVVSFDIKTLDKAPSGKMSFIAADGTEQEMMKFLQVGNTTLADGFPVAGFGSAGMTNYALAFNAKDKSCNVYVNGKLVIDDYILSSSSITAVSTVKFDFSSKDGSCAAILDNINIHSGTAPRKSYPTDEYSEETAEVPALEFGKRIGSNVQVNMDFENGVAAWAQLAQDGNKCEVITEDDGNKAFLFEKTTTNGAHINAGSASIANSDVLVYQFRIKMLEEQTFMVFQQKDTAGKFESVGEINDSQLCFPGGYSKQLKLNKWYNIALIEDYADRKITYYVDKEQVSEKTMTADYAINGADPGLFRFFITIYTSLSSKPRPTFNDPCKFLIDDMRIYEGDEILDNLGEIKKVIDVNTTKTVYSSDSAMKKMLEGRKAVHVRSGVVFNNDTKTLLQNTPFIKDLVEYLPVEETCAALGVTVSGQNDVVEKNGVSYMPAQKLFAAMGVNAKPVTSKINSGLYVIDDSNSFKAPTDDASLQSLNDFMFYLRPLEADIRAAYEKSENYGQHPRLYANKADFDRIRSESETNEKKKKYKAAIISDADLILTQDVVPYTLMPTGSILNTVARPVDQRLYSLAMAYQLTLDQKYVDRAYKEIESVGSYNWLGTSDHLVPAEIGSSMALAYDCMYDALTDEQKQFIEKTLYDQVLYAAHQGYMSNANVMGQGAIADNNHNVVVNAGVTATALVLYDVYPAEVSYTLRNSLRCADLMMYHFAPNGAWYEGPNYWEYTLQFTTKFLASLDTVLGTDFGFSTVEGLSTTADFALNTQTDLGIYNYADAYISKNYVPELYWLSNKYGNDDVTRIVLNDGGNTFNNAEDNALGLVWYNTSIEPGYVSMPIDKYYDDQDVIVMRDSWEAKEPTFVGIHAGETMLAHSQLDAGSYIFEDQGIRWAKELGMGDYSLPGYWEMYPGGQRWQYFRSRAESHNTILINPTEKEDHKVDSYAAMTIVEQKPRGNIVTVDMSEVLSDNAYDAKRGFFFTDNRKSLVIRDEIKLKGDSTVYWVLMTDAEAELTSDGHVVLTKDGKKLRLDYIAENAAAEFSCDIAKPLPTSPQVKQNAETDNRILIKLTGSGDITFTAKLSPDNMPGSDVSEYNCAISDWHVPDGEIPATPEIEEIKVGDETINLGGKNSVTYSFPDGSLDSVPQVSAVSDKYDISIKQAATLEDSAQITLTDKNDSSNINVYGVYFVKLPKPHQFEGKTSLPVYAFEVSGDSVGGEAKNMLDNNLDTRFAVEGTGNWAVLDLKDVQRVDDIAIAWYRGETGRKYSFTVSVSADGVNYTKVLDTKTSGTTSDYEIYSLGGVDARYIRLGLNGNDSGAAENWNSVLEFVAMRNN